MLLLHPHLPLIRPTSCFLWITKVITARPHTSCSQNKVLLGRHVMKNDRKKYKDKIMRWHIALLEAKCLR